MNRHCCLMYNVPWWCLFYTTNQYCILLYQQAQRSHPTTLYPYCCVKWLWYQSDTRNGVWAVVALKAYVVLIGKGVLVQQRLSAMTSSVLLIRNVGTWKIVIRVLTELHRQRLRPPHYELLQLKLAVCSWRRRTAFWRCIVHCCSGCKRHKRQGPCLAHTECARHTTAVSGVSYAVTNSNTLCWYNVRLSVRPSVPVLLSATKQFDGFSLN